MAMHTQMSPRDYYNLIERAVEKQTQQLLTPEPGAEQSKGHEISLALDRLYLAVITKYPEGVKIKKRFTYSHIDKAQIDKLDLTTVRKMLDVKIRVWQSEIAPSIEQGMEFKGSAAGYRVQLSLREALNISLDNVFNFLGGTWGPMWGKANSLTEVEKELKIS